MDTSTLPKSRAEAKAMGAKHYFTGEPCKHGHVAPRKTKGACTECLRVDWEKRNVARAEYFKQYNQTEIAREAKRKYYKKNRDAVIARAQARPLSEKRRWQKAWKDRNQLWVRADTKARRRKHRLATPKWLTRRQKGEIRQLYQIAMTMTQTTGEQYVVDHIIPLRSEFVCGLHVPWNLRVITREENLAKSNQIVDTLSNTAYTDSDSGVIPA